MIEIIVCLLICLTIIFCVVFIVHKGLPPIIIERREMEFVPDEPPKNEIGFKDSTETPETPDEALTDKEERERLLQDVASTITAVFRGEVDLDELN